MKISKILTIMVPVFFLVACLAAEPAIDEGLKTLRLTKLDTEAKVALFVPTQAVINGPGLATAPIKLQVGNDLIVQGMISLREDPEELVELTSRIERIYGPGIVLKKDLTANVKMKVSNSLDKPLWEHNVFSGNQGMPFQITISDNASESLKVNLKYTPSGTGISAKRHTFSITHSKTQTMSGNQATGSEQMQASFTTTVSPQTPDSFTVEQSIEF